jgi:hypothetical protein
MSSASQTIVLPAVSATDGVASSLVGELKATAADVVTLTVADLENSEKINAALNGDTSTLVIFPLPSVGDAADAAAAFAANDELVGRVFEQLSAADNSIVALLTAETESPATGAVRTLALSMPEDLVEEQASEEVVTIYRSRRDEVEGQRLNAGRKVSAAVKSCKGWTDLSYTRQYPNVNPVQQGGKTCRPGHMVGVSQKTEYFSSAVLSGITVGALIVSFVVMGVFALMLLQTNSKYPSMDDAQIIVSTRNE